MTSTGSVAGSVTGSLAESLTGTLAGTKAGRADRLDETLDSTHFETGAFENDGPVDSGRGTDILGHEPFDHYRGPKRKVSLPLLGPARFSPFTRLVIGVVGLAAVLAAAMYVRLYTADAREFPVNEVEVAGTLDYTDRDELRERVVSHTLDGFYALDLESIQDDVEQMPWVAQAHVRRISPDRVSLDVTEHEPAARWNDDALISKRFEMYVPPQLEPDGIQRAEWQAYFAQFPQLTGAQGRHEPVLEAYRSYQSLLDQFSTKVVALLEDDRHSQTLVLENKVTVHLGKTRQEERIQHFADVYERLVPRLDGQPVKFDMRYSNGFSVTNPGSPRATNRSNTLQPNSLVPNN